MTGFASECMRLVETVREGTTSVHDAADEPGDALRICVPTAFAILSSALTRLASIHWLA